MEDALRREFTRQLGTLLANGYPELARTTSDAFTGWVAPLEERLSAVRATTNGSRIPFVIVVRGDVVSAERSLPLVELAGKRGVVRMEPTRPAEFAAIDGLAVPPGAAYLLVDVDTGRNTRNVTPDDALETILAANRTPLTIDEGVALVTHRPEVLEAREAFSILGSRRVDRRVPALWISAGHPRLGWCWSGNPHTWLGSASCATRIGASS